MDATNPSEMSGTSAQSISCYASRGFKKFSKHVIVHEIHTYFTNGGKWECSDNLIENVQGRDYIEELNFDMNTTSK